MAVAQFAFYALKVVGVFLFLFIPMSIPDALFHSSRKPDRSAARKLLITTMGCLIQSEDTL